MHPENFGAELRQRIHKRLCEDVEGTVHGTTGIVVAVLRFYDEQDCERGLIEYETGHASFIVNYEAIVFRPFKSQVLDAKVTLTHEHGFNATVGLSNLSIFVSKHNMPREFAYRAEAEMWSMEDEDGAVEVAVDCVVRLRVVNVTFASKTEVTCIGTIDGDFLGVLEEAGSDDI
eukprot:CAMPEP_0172609982 /NCGR_PEP_ID=MMETSP1068-20121228/29863_1 /TAXON_ID=35684 /ORGANISM="Pseudopedinella elastica, Strain CCMP716" /LENGTH=173 /DNA_ID=CAMNT_0013413601 /DNA_START=306 /DNA_END=827 /DNA_ORIENTATION=+